MIADIFDVEYTGNLDDLPDTFVVLAGTIDPRLTEYAVGTTKVRFMETFASFTTQPPEYVVGIMKIVLEAIMKPEEEALNAMYLAQNRDWENWCDDVIIYTICRCYIGKIATVEAGV